MIEGWPRPINPIAVSVSSIRFLIVSALVLGGAGVGFRLGVLHASRTGPGARETVPPTEYFNHARSFSELENARAELDATVLRTLFELRRQRVDQPWRTDGSAPGEGLERVIEILRQSVEDLRGTEWELLVTRDLLVALKQSGRWQGWLDLYLETLYRRPASDVPSAFASEALRIGRHLGREEEAITALHYVLGNPECRSGRARIAALFDDSSSATSGDIAAGRSE